MILGALYFAGGGSVKETAQDAWRRLKPTPDPVLVFVVRDVGAVFDVLSSVDPERLVAASPDAIALRERRVVAASAEAVGPVLQVAGWDDAPLEIFAAGGAWAGPSAVAPEVATLLDKPTLTVAEARYLLGQM